MPITVIFNEPKKLTSRCESDKILMEEGRDGSSI